MSIFPYFYRLLLLPLAEQVGGLVLHHFVLGDDLHLQAGHLRGDGRVLTLDDVVERTPLALDVVAVHPCRRELEALSLQDALTFLV